MENTIVSGITKTENAYKNSNVEFWKNVEFNRFGIISMLLLVIACTGGVAASFGARSNTIELCTVAFPTMIALSLVLGVAPMKAIIYTSIVAIILDLLVLIF